MANPGINETKGKIAPSKSWIIIISVYAKMLNLTLQTEHHFSKIIAETQA